MTVSCCKKMIIYMIKWVNFNVNEDFYSWNCLHSFRTENKRDLLETVFKTHEKCKTVMSNHRNKILKYHNGKKQKSIFHYI